jgi:GAF domain-containing protein/nitrogen-specific signal transduction histidine kinase
LLVLGLSFSLLTYLLVRLVPRIRLRSKTHPKTAPALDLPAHKDAVFVIQPGGRISHLNQEARDQFELWEPEPNLEVLARRARPSDVFWALCAGEGQARFALDGRPVEATSYFLPDDRGKDNGHRDTILLSIRPHQAITLDLADSENVSRTLETLTHLNMAMTADLALEPTLQAILQNVEQLIPTDFSEITLWDSSDERLIPYRFGGIQGLERRLQPSPDHYRLGEGLAGQVAGLVEPVLIADIESHPQEPPLIDQRRFPYQSFVGVPLQVGGKLVGTLALMSRVANAYTQSDIHTLNLLSGQAAIAIHNAQIYQEERRRAEELSSLANLARAVSSARDSEELYGHLVQGITPLMAVQIAGFLIYDELQSALVAVSPFLGVPPQFVSLYKVSVPVGSPAEKVWLSQEPIITRKATEDPRLIDLGLDQPARAAGIRDTALVPLASSRRVLGYLQVANKRDDMPFNEDDLRLLEIIALQAAAIIENAHLIQESVGRALRAESLRRIASLSGSTATLDEIFKYSLIELARLIQADMAGIFLLDEGQGELQVHLESLYGIQASEVDRILRLPISGEDFRHTVTASKRPFLSGDASIDGRILPVFAGLVAPLDVRAVIDVPLILRDRGVGEILLCSHTPDAFGPGDIQLAATVAGQLAVAVERAQLAVHSDLELRQQVETLTALTRVNRELMVAANRRQVLRLVLDEALRLTLADGGTVMFWMPGHDTPGDFRIEHQLGRPHDPALTPLEDAIAASGEALLVEDFDHLPEQPLAGLDPDEWQPLQAGAQSALVVPITFQDQRYGLIYLDGRQPGHFDQASLTSIQTLADQAAISLDGIVQQEELQSQFHALRRQLDQYQDTQNQVPRLIHKVQEQTAEIHALEETSRRVHAGLGLIEGLNQQPDRKAVLAALGLGLIQQMGMDAALVAEYGPGGPQFVHILGEVPEGIHPEALLGQRNPLRESLQNGQALLVADLQAEGNWTRSPLLLGMKAAGFVSLPVMSGPHVDAAILGISRQPLRAFTENDRRLFDLLSAQAGLAINNLKILLETNHRLLEVNLLLDFSRQLGSLEPTHILQTLVDSSMQVAEKSQGGFVALLDRVGQSLIPQAGRGYRDVEALMAIAFPLDSLPGVVCTTGKPARIDELEFARSYPLPPDDLLHYRQATGGILPVSCNLIPIQSGDTPLGVIVLDNFEESAAFSAEDQAMVTSLAQQTALSLENARLYQAAENRANQLQALSMAVTTITPSLEPDDLVDSLLVKLGEVVPAETSTLWLRDGDRLTIRSARGFEDSPALLGVSTTLQDSRLFRDMVENSLAIPVDDVRQDPRFPSLEPERLSWLGVPLLAKGEMIGVIALEKEEPGFYTSDHVQAATTFASQAAVALENATLYQQSLLEALELDQRSQRLTVLNRFSNQISSVLDRQYILETTLRELLAAVPASAVSAILLEPDGPVLQAEIPTYLPGSPEPTALPASLPDCPLFERLQQTLGIFNSRAVVEEPELEPLSDLFADRQTISLLVLPLVTGDELHGLVLAHSDQTYYFNADDIELARIITNQAAVAVQNAASFEATRRLTAELEARVAERTAQLEQEYLREQSLLRIMRELSASLDLDQVLNQTLVILNETVGARHSTILLVHQEEGAFYYRASVGHDHKLPPGGQLSSLRLDEGLAGWVVQNRKSTVVGNVLEDPRWTQIGGLSTGYASVIAVPLMVGEELLGVVTLGHPDVDTFTAEDQEMAQAAAMQMAVAINNAELFNLIRDQAEGLGTMLRSQQVEASRSMAILEAVADGVLVTDDAGQITLFNHSAQTILDLPGTAVTGKSLEDFTGLFGRAAKTWMDTIRAWASDPASYQIGETYAERITLDNERVVAIHLAPVSMGEEFLGTVTIFRDITHQVAVDRLKSEFVATVSHELRTPMTSIKGYVDILLMGAAGQLTQQQTAFLDIVKTNTERLNILVNDLLDVSRIEAGKLDLVISPLDLRVMIEAVIRDIKLRSEKEGRPMDFVLDVPANLPRVPADEERLFQILDNLVINAYLYTPPGGRIEIQAVAREDEIQVHIKDNGIGIHPDDHERIFERFYRGEDPLVLASSGNGLGLSIARQLVDMHQGRLWLISEGVSGKGSTFSFALPLERSPIVQET